MGAALPAAAQTWQVLPDVSLKTTYTDNVNQQSDEFKRSDLVFNIAPGVRIVGRGPRLAGDASLRVDNAFHMDRSSDNKTSVSANAGAQLEAIDDFFFIDGSMSINRQNVSLFGTNNSADYNTDSNQAEVRTADVTPSLKWRFGNSTVGEARYTLGYTDSSDRALENQVTHSWSANLADQTALGRLGWALSASASDGGAGVTRNTETRNYQVALTYAYSAALGLRIFGGREWNTFGEEEKNSPNYGGAFDWAPTSRTVLNAQVSKRFFGTGYNFRFAHRLRRTAFDITYVRDVARSTQTLDPLLDLLTDALDRTTDPNERQLISDYIATYNANRNQLNYVSNAYTLEKRLRAALTMDGVRNTVGLSLTYADRQSIADSSFVLTGDFQTFDRTEETAALLYWTLRLSGRTNMTTRLSRSRAEGMRTSGTAADRNTTEFGIGLDTSIGAYSTGGLSYRHVRSTGTTDYRENAISASFAHRF